MILNEYLRNHSKPLVSWSSARRFIASNDCMQLGKRGTKKGGKTDPQSDWAVARVVQCTQWLDQFRLGFRALEAEK